MSTASDRTPAILRIRVCAVIATRPPHTSTSDVIEFGRADLHTDGVVVEIDSAQAHLFRPRTGLLPPASTIGGLTAADLPPETGVFCKAECEAGIWTPTPPDLLAAHDVAALDQLLPVQVTRHLPWVCTRTVAQHLWPQAPVDHLDTLAEWCGLAAVIEAAGRDDPPGRAAFRARMTAILMTDMMGLMTIEEMATVSAAGIRSA